MKYLIAVFLLCCSMQYAVAGGYTGNDLKSGLGLVHHASPTVVDGLKGGYTMGFIDGIAMEMVLSKEICTPPGFQREQSIQIVENYLNTVPQLWTYSAAALVHVALERALPCTSGHGRK